MPYMSPLQKIEHPLFSKYKLTVCVKRDDLIHPIISGNKWRKLKHNITFAQKNGYEGIISFGGAYSNHIHALAYAGFKQNFKTKAIIRGEDFYRNNCTLSQAINWGMECRFVDRKTYRLRDNANYLKGLQTKYPNYFIVPEGGSNQLALQGVGEVVSELNQQLTFDTIILPIGSAGTLAGLVKADKNQHDIIGIAVLKNAKYLNDSVNNLTKEQYIDKSCIDKNVIKKKRWHIVDNLHRGGYGKFSHDDEERLYLFNKETGVTFEPIYSGKMLLAFLDLIPQGGFKENTTIVLLHTGGLQGINGLIEQNKLQASRWR